MLGGTKGGKSGSKSAGLAQASMTAMISADTSIKQVKVQGSVATSMEGRAGVLESEIKNNHGSDVTKKKEELADVTQKAQAATASQMNTLAEANKAVEEAAVAERGDNKTSGAKEEKTGQAENTAEKAAESGTNGEKVQDGVSGIGSQTGNAENVQRDDSTQAGIIHIGVVSACVVAETVNLLHIEPPPTSAHPHEYKLLPVLFLKKSAEALGNASVYEKKEIQEKR